MLVMGHTIDEQWDLIQQFEGFVEHGLTDVVETWLGAHKVPSALTAAAGDNLLDGEGSFSALWQSQVEGVFTTYLTSVYDASALALAHDALSQADLAAGLGVAGVPDDFSADFVHQTANKMVGVSDQVWQNIRTELAKGVAANEDIEQLADRVRTAASVSMPRALTVARTTVIAASNAGSYAQASLLAGDGGMKKRWVATEDNRVRPDHHNADGQTVDMTSPFMVGGWAMMYPGDPAGPADEVINCRCTITYEFDEIQSVCECGSEPALVAAAKPPKVSVPMGASCICPAVASLTPLGYSLSLSGLSKADQKYLFDDFRGPSKITPSIGGAKIHKQLQQIMNSYGFTTEDTEQLLDLIDEQYALSGGKTSFKAKYEEWLQTNAGKKAVPQAFIPAPAPATVEPRGLSLIKAPNPGDLKIVGGAGGTHGAQILVDQTTGERWLFKPYTSGSEFGAKLDVSTARLQSRMGLPQPSVHTIRFNGKYGSVQSMHDATEAFPKGSYDPLKLTEAEILDLQREEVLDWLISNNDSHSGNFLRLKNGQLVGVDKGQAFKYLAKDGKLDWSVTLHTPLSPDKLVYQPMWKAFAEGKNIQLFDPSTGALRDLIEQTMSIPDTEFRDILRPFAEQALKDSKLAYGDVDKFLDIMVQRKNNLAADFQKMYDKALSEREKVLGVSAPTPPPVVAPVVVAPAAPVDYQALWSQLDNLEQNNFIKAFKDAKSYYDSGAPIDEVMKLLKEDIVDNPSEWLSVVKNSGVEDLKGLMKVAGDALGNDTGWLGVSGGPSSLFTAGQSPAVAAAKAALSNADLAFLSSELRFQVETGHVSLDDAFTHMLNQVQHHLSAKNFKIVENLTNDEIFALVKDYQTAVGMKTDWIDSAIGKYATSPVAPVTPVAVVPPTALDVNDLANSAGFAGQGDFASMFYELKSIANMGIGDYQATLDYFKTTKAKAALSKKGFQALGQLTDDEITSFMQQYGDALHKDTSWIPKPAATSVAAPAVATVSTAVDLLDISNVPLWKSSSLYTKYKQLKPVTPSWGGAAIFKNLQALKATLGPEFAGLNDGQLLKMLDKVWYQNAKAGSKSYYDEVTSWLKTPGGKKYLQDNGIMPPPDPAGITPVATKAPSVPPAAPVVTPVTPGTSVAAPAKKAAKAAKAAKKAAKPPAILDTVQYLDNVTDKAFLDQAVTDLNNEYINHGGDITGALAKLRDPHSGILGSSAFKSWESLSDDQVIALLKIHADKSGTWTGFPTPKIKMKKIPTPAVQFTSSAGDISTVDPGLKQQVFDKIKAQSVYLSSTGQKIWDSIKFVKANVPGADKLTDLQIVRILDDVSATKFGKPNNSLYEQKLIKWLKTSSGKQYAGGASSGSTGGLPPIVHPKKGTLFNPGAPNQTGFVTTPETYDIISNSEALRLRGLNPPLTAAQKAGMKEYTGSSYTPINNALRKGHTISDSLARQIRAAQSGMHPSTRPMLLHRGTGSAQFSNLGLTNGASFADIKALEGKEFVDEAFMSTSVGGRAAFGGQPVLIELEAPTGTPMAYVDDFSKNRGENEMLLAAGLRFRILSVSQSGTGYYSPIVVRMRVLPP